MLSAKKWANMTDEKFKHLLSGKATEPKYKRLAQSIRRMIGSGEVELGAKLPSINEIAAGHSVARDTVVKAFDLLTAENTLRAVHGVGYFAASTDALPRTKVLLIFDGMHSYKSELLNGILKALGPNYEVSVYVHHLDPRHLSSLLDLYAEENEHVAIIPTMNTKETKEVVLSKAWPTTRRLYFLDRSVPGARNIPCVYQHFERGIHGCLSEALPALKKYKKTNLFCDRNNHIGRELIRGFSAFGKEHDIQTGINPERPLRAGEAYVIVNDDQLIDRLKEIKAVGLRPGRDLGILSYNDSPFKELICGGLAVCSTDFRQMGRTLADMIKNHTGGRVEIPTRLIMRASL